LPEEEQQEVSFNETLRRLTGVLTRRRWWILLPFFCITLATIAVLWMLPNRYTSTATLLVVQQQVPQRYVVPNSQTDVTSALQAMKQEVLSRTQLLRMINDFGLYPTRRTRSASAPEELVALMLSNIGIEPVSETPQQTNKDFDSFRISFTTENALLAQRVTSKLTSLFINEYLRTGAEQSSNTTNFLHQQVEDKGKELEIQEARLRDFKLQHVGELPEQQAGNLGILTGLQSQLQNTTARLESAQQQRQLLEAQLEAAPRRRTGQQDGVFAPDKPNLTPIEAAQGDLDRLEAARSTLLSKGYTSEHPDVITNKREIAQAEDKLKRLLAAGPATDKAQLSARAAAGKSPSPDTTEDPAVSQLKTSLEANRLEIEGLTNDERRLTSSVSQYESRLNQTPVREQQQASILRDTEVLRHQYADLQQKEQESQLATNLEKQQGGRQFRLIDPPSLPAVPSSPKRARISLAGAVVGLFLGFGLALFVESRDTSFHTEKELVDHLAPPFVLGIPVIPTRVEKRRRKWGNTFQWVAASAILLVVVAAEFYVYVRG
jgi:succinoglycan biosynthesis transport protein ExoP